MSQDAKQMPVLFVSHGAPNLAVFDCPARKFLTQLTKNHAEVAKPKAIVVLSPHWPTYYPAVTSGTNLETIYDFGGFDPALNRIVYPAKGAPELAARIEGLIKEAGFQSAQDPQRGLDHGAWVPLYLAYPDADVPVVAVSIMPREAPDYHIKLGEALAPLRREGVLIIASGSMTHNLSAIQFRAPAAPAYDWVASFTSWVNTSLEARDIAGLARYRQHPTGTANHPSAEHFLPLFVAVGAAGLHKDGAGTATRVERIHHSTMYAALNMDAYMFSDQLAA